MHVGSRDAVRVTNEPTQPLRMIDAGTQQVLERRLRDLVRGRHWHSVSQPIVSIQSGRPLGIEALTRPHGEPPLDSPSAFLALASRLGVARAVEADWRTDTLRELGGKLPDGILLFLNASPLEFTEGTLRAQNLSSEVRLAGLTPENVVLEITEGDRIHDFGSLRQSLGPFRSAGFQIAIDDVGAGPSSLQAIAELRPHFIKLDRWLATDIGFDDARRAVVESMVTLARRVKASVIAEGVESADQVRAFAELGVAAVQGYFIGMPRPGLASPEPDAIKEIEACRLSQRRRSRKWSETVEGVASQPVVVSPDMLGSELAQIFERDRELSAVVTTDGSSIGVVTRDRFLRTFAEQYGPAIYGRRPIKELAMPASIVSPSSSIRDAARTALARRSASRNDPIVAADGREVVGIVDVLDLIEAALEEEVNEARESNPLTGLPGNRSIRQFIERLTPAQRHSLTAIYADIDHFKQFNDRFGFGAGDLAIAKLAGLLQQSVTVCQRPSFIGHIGGDDFLLVVDDVDLNSLRRELSTRMGGMWLGPSSDTDCDRVSVTFAAAPLAALRGTFEDQAEQLSRFKTELKLGGGDCFGILETLDEEASAA